jgi:hypothetical protein
MLEAVWAMQRNVTETNDKESEQFRLLRIESSCDLVERFGDATRDERQAAHSNGATVVYALGNEKSDRAVK